MEEKKEVVANTLIVGRWFYSKPCSERSKEDNLVFVSKYSFGPVETFEWGIDPNGAPYEKYEWLENDFFEDESYERAISMEQLTAVVEEMRALVSGTSLECWNDTYAQLLALIKE